MFDYFYTRILIVVLGVLLFSPARATNIPSETLEKNDLHHCIKISQNQSTYIKKICFRYDTKLKFSTLMSEPVDYSVMRWFWKNPINQSIYFRDSNEMQGVSTYYDILNNQAFKESLRKISIAGKFYVKVLERNSNSISNLYYFSDPGVLFGANANWSFNTPGSSNWDKLYVRSLNNNCDSVAAEMKKTNFLSANEAKSIVRKGITLATPLLCDAKVYGIEDINFVIRQIIEEKCKKSPINCGRQSVQKTKVKDWFKKNDQQKNAQGNLIKNEIVNKNTKGAVTDWFAVNRTEKELATTYQKQREEEKIALEKKLGSKVVHSSVDGKRVLVENNGIHSIIDDSGNLIKQFSQKFRTVHFSNEGLYLATGPVTYSSEKEVNCKTQAWEGKSEYILFSKANLKQTRTGTKPYRYLESTFCLFTSG